jgi:23S rRNA (cytosine1962-C5)-methyltransferase
MPSGFENRLAKRFRHLGKKFDRWPTQAWRVYDRDMPEMPWTVDLYGDAAVVQEFAHSKASDEERAAQLDDVVGAVGRVCGVSPDDLFYKARKPQKGGAQYQRQGREGAARVVREGDLRFEVNLSDYIDTGLFPDHRNLRREVARRTNRRTRMLNLFCYTGAFSVWAARAGAHVTSVDLSNTYLSWAERNFSLNALDPAAHIFKRADVLRWLPGERDLGRRYEIIVCDPPTFSRSKSMERDLDIQRDHPDLIDVCVELLAPGGVLFFSNNLTTFSMSGAITRRHRVEEITRRTSSEDFRHRPHRAWEIHAR